MPRVRDAIRRARYWLQQRFNRIRNRPQRQEVALQDLPPLLQQGQQVHQQHRDPSPDEVIDYLRVQTFGDVTNEEAALALRSVASMIEEQATEEASDS